MHDLPPVPVAFVSQIRRPSTERYRDLVVKLLQAARRAERGDDQLYVILDCIVSVIAFLDGDEVVLRNVLARPLDILARSLRDLGQGSKPKLFFGREKEGGRPKDVSFEGVRGNIAALVALLIEWGEEPQNVARFVTQTLQSLGVKAPRDKPISPRQVLRWKYEIGATDAELFQKAARDSLSRYRERYPDLATAASESHKEFARNVLSAIWSKGF